jgi:hypothetical protein
MSASTGMNSYSSSIGVDPTGGVTYVIQAEVREIGFPDMKISQSDRSNLSSPNAAREFTPGMIDPGDIKLKLNFTQTQYALFLTNLRKSAMGWQIAFPLIGSQTTAAKLAGQGAWSEVGGAIPEDDTVTNDVTLKCTGLPVFTAGS